MKIRTYLRGRVYPPERTIYPAPRDQLTEAAVAKAARVLAEREGPTPATGASATGAATGATTRKLWLVRELERVIVESPAPARVYAGCAPNIFFSFEEVRRYTRQCTLDWIRLILVDIEEERRDPVMDPAYWEALARLELLLERGWPVVRE